MPKMTESGIERREQERELQVSMGQRMRWARRLVEPNALAFAKLLGIHSPVITRVEAGKSAASALLVREYAARLRVTTDYILFGRLQPQPMDYEMQLRLVSEHPELVGLQRTGNNHLDMGH